MKLFKHEMNSKYSEMCEIYNKFGHNMWKYPKKTKFNVSKVIDKGIQKPQMKRYQVATMNF